MPRPIGLLLGVADGRRTNSSSKPPRGASVHELRSPAPALRPGMPAGRRSDADGSRRSSVSCQADRRSTKPSLMDVLAFLSAECSPHVGKDPRPGSVLIDSATGSRSRVAAIRSWRRFRCWSERLGIWEMMALGQAIGPTLRCLPSGGFWSYLMAASLAHDLSSGPGPSPNGQDGERLRSTMPMIAFVRALSNIRARASGSYAFDRLPGNRRQAWTVSCSSDRLHGQGTDQLAANQD